MIKSLERLSRAWQGLPLGSPLWFFETVSSTNDVLKERAGQGAAEGSVVMASAQTGGRGRRGKSWLSPPALGLYLSVLLRPAWPAADAGFSATLAAVAAARTLCRLGMKDITLKWPNDVLAGGRKIAGVLAEPRIAGNKIDFIVAGVGINVRHDAFSLAGVWQGQATSCRMEGCPASVEDAATGFIIELSELYQKACQGRSEEILAAWLAFQPAAAAAKV